MTEQPKGKGKAKPYQYRQPAQLYGETDVTPAQHRTMACNAPVTPSRDKPSRNANRKQPTVTPSHDNADPILADILDRLATIEAYIDDRQRAAKSQAERAKAYRDRKKQQVTQ